MEYAHAVIIGRACSLIENEYIARHGGIKVKCSPAGVLMVDQLFENTSHTFGTAISCQFHVYEETHLNVALMEDMFTRPRYFIKLVLLNCSIYAHFWKKVGIVQFFL
jgi:hypothetical protein